MEKPYESMHRCLLLQAYNILMTHEACCYWLQTSNQLLQHFACMNVSVIWHNRYCGGTVICHAEHNVLVTYNVVVDLAGQQTVPSRQEHIWACIFQVCCVLLIRYYALQVFTINTHSFIALSVLPENTSATNLPHYILLILSDCLHAFAGWDLSCLSVYLLVYFH